MTVKRIKQLATDNGVGFRQPAVSDIILGENAAGSDFFYTDYQSIQDTVTKTGFADVKAYGAVGDGVTDDGPAILLAIGDGITAPLNENVTVYFPKGQYFIGTNVLPILFNKGLTLIGEDGSELVIQDSTFSIIAPETITARTGAIAVDAFRGDRVITMNSDASLVEPGDVITITNSNIAELQFSYTTSQTMLCVEKSGNDIELSRPLNFDFPAAAPDNLVVARRQAGSFRMHNMTVHDIRTSGSVIAIRITGFFNPIITDLTLTSDEDADTQFSTMFQIQDCVDTILERVEVYQAFLGVLVANSLDTTIRNVRSSFGRVPIVPSTFSQNVLIQNLVSTWDNAGIESHPAFNVTYENFQTRDSNIVNLRSIGGALKNGTIRTPAGAATVPLFQSTELTDPSAYADYGFLMENVEAEFGGQPFILRRSEKFTRLINCDFPNTVVQFGLTPPTEFIVKNITLRNVRAPSILYTAVDGAIDAGNDILDAELDGGSGRYEINMATPPVVGREINIDETHVRSHGEMFSQLTTDPLTVAVRVYDIWYQQQPIPTTLRIKGILNLRVSMDHDDAGTFDIVEKSFNVYHKPVPSPVVDIPLVPSFVSDPVGSTNETLDVSISNPTEGGVATADAFFQFDLTLDSGGRTNPKFSAVYELDLWA